MAMIFSSASVSSVGCCGFMDNGYTERYLSEGINTQNVCFPMASDGFPWYVRCPTYLPRKHRITSNADVSITLYMSPDHICVHNPRYWVPERPPDDSVNLDPMSCPYKIQEYSSARYWHMCKSHPYPWHIIWRPPQSQMRKGGHIKVCPHPVCSTHGSTLKDTCLGQWAFIRKMPPHACPVPAPSAKTAGRSQSSHSTHPPVSPTPTSQNIGNTVLAVKPLKLSFLKNCTPLPAEPAEPAGPAKPSFPFPLAVCNISTFYIRHI